MTRGIELLGCSYPILCGGMTWVSNHSLTAAVSCAGGFGVLACGAMTPQLLKAEIEKTKALCTKPFGVNLILLHPNLSDLIDVCCAQNVSHVILAGGIPKKSTIEYLKNAQITVLCFAPNASLARRLISMGADALIIEGHEAGGHIGPVSTIVLAQEVLLAIKDVPVFVAGGIGRGEMITQLMKMGAAGCQLGTRFVCAKESPAHSAFKNAFINASAKDAVVSTQLDERFPVIPVRSLVNNGYHDFHKFQRMMIHQHERGDITLKDAQMNIEHYWAGALRRAVIEGDIQNGSLMAGQSVSFVEKEEPVSNIIKDLLYQMG